MLLDEITWCQHITMNIYAYTRTVISHKNRLQRHLKKKQYPKILRLKPNVTKCNHLVSALHNLITLCQHVTMNIYAYTITVISHKNSLQETFSTKNRHSRKCNWRNSDEQHLENNNPSAINCQGNNNTITPLLETIATVFYCHYLSVRWHCVVIVLSMEGTYTQYYRLSWNDYHQGSRLSKLKGILTNALHTNHLVQKSQETVSRPMKVLPYPHSSLKIRILQRFECIYYYKVLDRGAPALTLPYILL